MRGGRSVDPFTQITGHVITEAFHHNGTIGIPVISYIECNTTKLNGVSYFSKMIG